MDRNRITNFKVAFKVIYFKSLTHPLFSISSFIQVHIWMTLMEKLLSFLNFFHETSEYFSKLYSDQRKKKNLRWPSFHWWCHPSPQMQASAHLTYASLEAMILTKHSYLHITWFDFYSCSDKKSIVTCK